MSTELDEVRMFRAGDAIVDAQSQQAARATLLAHIAGGTDPAHASLYPGAPAGGRRGGQRARGGRQRWRASLSVFVVGTSVGAVAIVVAIAVIAGGDRAVIHTQPAGAAPRERLIHLLGVLREPQTAAARSFTRPGWPEPSHAPGSQIRPDRTLIRLATVTPWGAKVFLVPFTPPTSADQRRALGEPAALWVQGIGWSDYSTLDAITSGDAWGPQATDRQPGHPPASRSFEIVPDGVAKVGLYTNVTLRPFHAGGLILTPVRHNIAVFGASGTGGRLIFAVWYAADGHLIKRVGAWTLAARRPTAVHPCQTPQLQIRRGYSSAGLGSTGAYVEFINRSGTPCEMHGWPTLVAQTPGHGSSRAQHLPGSTFTDVTIRGVPTVTLAPDQRADAVFSASDGDTANNKPCGHSYRTLRITPPGNTHSVTISAWIPYLGRYLPRCAPIRLSPVLPRRSLYKG
jgi:hypothetical protein